MSGTASSSAVLELASDVNLGTTFEVGDDVKASASYTPETDVISSVTDISPSITPTPNPNTFTNPKPYTSNTFDGVLFTQLVEYTFSPAWNMSDVKYFRGGGYAPGDQFNLRFYYTDGTFEDFVGTTQGEYNGSFDISSTLIQYKPPVSRIVVPYAMVGFYNVYEEGVSYNLSSQPQLTLATEKDIQLFQVGDGIQLPVLEGVEGAYFVVGGDYKLPNDAGQGFNGSLTDFCQSVEVLHTVKVRLM